MYPQDPSSLFQQSGHFYSLSAGFTVSVSYPPALVRLPYCYSDMACCCIYYPRDGCEAQSCLLNIFKWTFYLQHQLYITFFNLAFIQEATLVYKIEWDMGKKESIMMYTNCHVIHSFSSLSSGLANYLLNSRQSRQWFCNCPVMPFFFFGPTFFRRPSITPDNGAFCGNFDTVTPIVIITKLNLFNPPIKIT